MAKLFSSKDGFKFVDASGMTTAVLDQDGTLTLKDGNSSLDKYESWEAFVKQMGDTPSNGNEEDILEQLGSKLGLGKAEMICREEGDGTPVKVLDPQKEKEVSTKVAEAKKVAATKKVAVAAKKAPAKKAAPREKAEKVMTPCHCGCKTLTGGAKGFAPGHDAKVHGWAKKVAKGEMQLGELSASAQAWCRAEGVKQGKKAKEA